MVLELTGEERSARCWWDQRALERIPGVAPLPSQMAPAYSVTSKEKLLRNKERIGK